MEKPNKEDYDFNEVFEGVRFAANMIKYADQLESELKRIVKFVNAGLTPLEWKDVENANQLKSLIAIHQRQIDKLEAENKSLKENLQAIAGSTQDSEEPLTKCIHGIAVKYLKK